MVYITDGNCCLLLHFDWRTARKCIRIRTRQWYTLVYFGWPTLELEKNHSGSCLLLLRMCHVSTLTKVRDPYPQKTITICLTIILLISMVFMLHIYKLYQQRTARIQNKWKTCKHAKQNYDLYQLKYVREWSLFALIQGYSLIHLRILYINCQYKSWWCVCFTFWVPLQSVYVLFRNKNIDSKA